MAEQKFCASSTLRNNILDVMHAAKPVIASAATQSNFLANQPLMNRRVAVLLAMTG
jgi:hypothetical protein